MMNITQLKKTLLDKGFTGKGTYRKRELEYLVHQVDYALANEFPTSITTNGKKPIAYEPAYCILGESQTYIDHLNRYGWATVPIPDYDYKSAAAQFIAWIDRHSPTFNPKAPSKWLNNQLPPNLHGIFKHYIGHESFIWEARRKSAPIFEEIWGTDDLYVSFDGGCFLSKQTSGQGKSWLHCDQSRQPFGLKDSKTVNPSPFDTIYGAQSVQGIVNLYDNGPNDGGLLVLEGSKEVFDEYYRTHPVDGMGGFTMIDTSDPLLETCVYKKICAPAGHLLLFDSRVYHCNVPPKRMATRHADKLNNRYYKGVRLCIYVSFQPKCHDPSEEHRKNRVKAFLNSRMTGHWCSGVGYNVASYHPFRASSTIQIKQSPLPELSDKEKAWIGLI